MRKVERKKTITEKVYVSSDGKEFDYECFAREHDIELVKSQLEKNGIKKASIPKDAITFFEKECPFYYAENSESTAMILSLFYEQYEIIPSFEIDSIGYPEWIGIIWKNGSPEITTIEILEDKIKDLLFL